MAQKLDASMPENVQLSDGYAVRLTAVDPSSGATVSGVKVSNVCILATSFIPDAAQDDVGVPVAPLPILTLLELNEEEAASG
jgi:hypothetical protein